MPASSNVSEKVKTIISETKKVQVRKIRGMALCPGFIGEMEFREKVLVVHIEANLRT